MSEDYLYSHSKEDWFYAPEDLDQAKVDLMSEKDKKIDDLLELNAAIVRDMENLKSKQKELQEKIEDILLSVG